MSLYLCTMVGALLMLCLAQEVQAKMPEGHGESHLSAKGAPAVIGSESGASRSFSGNMSWYGKQFTGKKTASGELFDSKKSTAAHRTLSFGTRILVEDPRTGKTVIVKVNDRGPYVQSRVMDVSHEGARRLGTLMDGVAFVDCLVLKTNLDR
jgi:rare lipoprotein A (peptidoglycan hydrolase)